jgi:hypothetical protein
MGNYQQNKIGFMFYVSCFMKRVLIFLFLLLPITMYAQSLNLISPKTSYNVGDSFVVSLSINTNNKPINTISGTVRAPNDKFQISDVRYGNSIITLWVEKPSLNISAGTIVFAGGIPGGYNGSNGPILSFAVKAKISGSALISLDNFSVLLNDGLGTALSNLNLSKLNLTINKAPPPAPKPKKAEPVKEPEVYIPPPDIIAPEDFMPVVSRHPDIAENSFFVSFFAVDKDSGISHYEIRENPKILTRITSKFDKIGKGETPYILKIQYWPSEIVVRAYDQAGNIREEKIVKPIHPILMWAFIGFWTLIVIGASYFYFQPKTVQKKKIRKLVV